MRLKIGYMQYEVTFVPDEDNYGTCDRDKGIINLDPEQLKFKQIDTILHEAGHGIWDMWGLPDTPASLEEKIIRPLMSGMATFLHDNPEFVEWLYTEICCEDDDDGEPETQTE